MGHQEQRFVQHLSTRSLKQRFHFLSIRILRCRQERWQCIRASVGSGLIPFLLELCGSTFRLPVSLQFAHRIRKYLVMSELIRVGAPLCASSDGSANYQAEHGHSKLD
jgi:hypothetical protein